MYMYNTVTRVYFRKLRRAIYGMFDFKKPTCLDACWVNQTQPHLVDEEKKSYSEKKMSVLQAQLT